jgi:adenylyltransferase/sulfurtransferase
MKDPGAEQGGGPTPSDFSGFEREELIRYARHFVLPRMGPKGQRALKESRVVVVGAGGLGSPVALYLAAAGVGTLGLVDWDIVDLSNLQRQILHGSGQVGRRKLDSARVRLRDTNPHVDVITHPVRLTGDNALDLLGSYDVVVDGSDNFPTRYLVNDASVLLGKPYVYGAVDRWEGQISVFAADGGPCYRCLFREPPPPGLVPSCAEAGVLGVVPGVIGSLQALETIKLILGTGDSLSGRLLIFDALESSWREVRLRRDPECPVCGDDPSQTTLIDYDLFCGVYPEPSPPSPETVQQISPRELEARLATDPPPLILDVREPYEWEIGNLAPRGACLIPMGEIRSRIEEIPRDRAVVVFCHVGVRSAHVAAILVDEGFSDVANLAGGYVAWLEDVDPKLPRY